MTARAPLAIQGLRALARHLVRGRYGDAPGFLVLVCYGKADCSLCDKAKDPVERAIRAYGGRVTAEWRDILADEGLVARWGERIPVICAGETILAEGKVSDLRLRRALAAYLADVDAGGGRDV